MTGAADGDGNRIESFRTAIAPLDGTRLKRVAVVTYFGVYALIAVGGWRWLVDASQQVPPLVRPPAFAPLHVILGIPRSFAWGVVSLSITGLAVAAVATIQLRRGAGDRQGEYTGSDRSIGKGLVAHTGGSSRPRGTRLRTAVAEAGQSLRERVPLGTSSERSSLGERVRGRSLPDVRRPSRPDFERWRDRAPRPDTSRLRWRVPRPSEFLRRQDEAAVRLHDGSLPALPEPLSLPQSTDVTRMAVELPESHAFAEGVVTAPGWEAAGADPGERVEAREWEISRGTGTAYAVDATTSSSTADGAVVESAVEAVGGSEVAVTGGSEPSPDAPWPADTADSGSDPDAKDDPDASAPWPDGWRSGDEL